MLNVKIVKQINESEFSELVRKTYNRPYRLQQTDGCYSRGSFTLTISSNGCEAYPTTAMSNGGDGESPVSFQEWIQRDRNEPIPISEKDIEAYEALKNSSISNKSFYDPNNESNKKSREVGGLLNTLWWEREFYPDLNELLDDMLSRGLIEEGEYEMEIDW